MERYSAKLLFQFRVVTAGIANKRRTCEERIIVLNCHSAKEALRKAKEAGRDAQYQLGNDTEGAVYFEFVGVVDLQHLGAECGTNEVWYDIKELVTPMERKNSLLPSEANLSAIALERGARNSGSSEAKATVRSRRA